MDELDYTGFDEISSDGLNELKPSDEVYTSGSEDYLSDEVDTSFIEADKIPEAYPEGDTAADALPTVEFLDGTSAVDNPQPAQNREPAQVKIADPYAARSGQPANPYTPPISPTQQKPASAPANPYAKPAVPPYMQGGINGNASGMSAYGSNQGYNSSYGNSKINPMDTPLYAAETEMVFKGEKMAKIIAIIVIVISALDAISMLTSGNITGVVGAGVRVWASIAFMRGSHRGRIFLSVVSILTTLIYLFYTFNFNKIFSAFDSSITLTTMVGVFQVIFLLISAGFGVLAYLLLFNKNIKAYCDRSVF